MSDRKPCFLTATELAYGVRAKELLAVRVTEAHLAQLVHPSSQVNAVVTLSPEEEREATPTSSAGSQAPRTREGLV
jgi:Asp-tRNA(Asn)/Glu-tRNA(Gln) amidotransferase A subunit family amidase